jgi:hypothetical protein
MLKTAKSSILRLQIVEFTVKLLSVLFWVWFGPFFSFWSLVLSCQKLKHQTNHSWLHLLNKTIGSKEKLGERNFCDSKLVIPPSNTPFKMNQFIEGSGFVQLQKQHTKNNFIAIYIPQNTLTSFFLFSTEIFFSLSITFKV